MNMGRPSSSGAKPTTEPPGYPGLLGCKTKEECQTGWSHEASSGTIHVNIFAVLRLRIGGHDSKSMVILYERPDVSRKPQFRLQEGYGSES